MDTETMDALVTESGRKAPARLAGSAILACQSDERLVELVRAGHERAFDAIVDRYRRPLVRFAGGILPESRSDDAVQQAFINAHAALLEHDEPVQLKPWLYTITRNASLNMLRQNGWNHEQIPADFDGVLRPDQAVEQKIQLERTVAAVNQLPDRQREALVMREFEGRSYQEIALALGANDGAVRQLLNRARGTLRAIATAIMPPPIVTRAATSLPPSDGRRVAEVLGSFGAAGIVKVGASAVVAGTLVVGAVKAPLPLHDQPAKREKATISAAQKPRARTESISAASAAPTTSASQRPAAGNPRGTHGKSQSRHAGGAPAVQEHHGAREPSDDRSGPSSGGHRSGSDDGSGSRERHSGSTDDRSGSNSGPGGGSDDSTRTESRSGSDDSDKSGSGSGSDDVIAIAPSETTSGSAESESGTSGSGTSGSGTSGSGSSGSGSGSDDAISDSSGPGPGPAISDD